MLFEMIGAQLIHPKVDSAQVWNTRWLSPTSNDLMNTLDQDNGLRPTGRALAIWGQFLQSAMVQSTSTSAIRTFASYNPTDGQLSIFLVNKDLAAHPTTLNIANYRSSYQASQWELRGDGPADLAPTWGSVRDFSGSGSFLAITLDPVSITVLILRPSAPIAAPSGQTIR